MSNRPCCLLLSSALALAQHAGKPRVSPKPNLNLPNNPPAPPAAPAGAACTGRPHGATPASHVMLARQPLACLAAPGGIKLAQQVLARRLTRLLSVNFVCLYVPLTGMHAATLPARQVPVCRPMGNIWMIKNNFTSMQRIMQVTCLCPKKRTFRKRHTGAGRHLGGHGVCIDHHNWAPQRVHAVIVQHALELRRLKRLHIGLILQERLCVGMTTSLSLATSMHQRARHCARALACMVAANGKEQRHLHVLELCCPWPQHFASQATLGGCPEPCM